jgi:hypothetical protein
MKGLTGISKNSVMAAARLDCEMDYTYLAKALHSRPKEMFLKYSYKKP